MKLVVLNDDCFVDEEDAIEQWAWIAVFDNPNEWSFWMCPESEPRQKNCVCTPVLHRPNKAVSFSRMCIISAMRALSFVLLFERFNKLNNDTVDELKTSIRASKLSQKALSYWDSFCISVCNSEGKLADIYLTLNCSLRMPSLLTSSSKWRVRESPHSSKMTVNREQKAKCFDCSDRVSLSDESASDASMVSICSWNLGWVAKCLAPGSDFSPSVSDKPFDFTEVLLHSAWLWSSSFEEVSMQRWWNAHCEFQYDLEH